MATKTAWKRVGNDYKSCSFWTHSQSSAPPGWPDFQKTCTVGSTVTADPADAFCDEGRYIYPSGGGIVAFGNTDDAPADAALGWVCDGRVGFAGTGPARVVLLQFDDVTDVIAVSHSSPKWVIAYALSSAFVLSEHSPPPRIYPW